tara:strand:+ start:597 stop:1715 length:1119 start_codon:yes stop_codon:yes gene_type:complete
VKQEHICHVISGYFRDNPRIFNRQCLSLKKNNYQVSILTNDNLEDEVIEGISIISTKKKFKSRLLVILFSIIQFYEDALKIDSDYYQLHSPELLPLGILLKFRGKKIIYDAHEDMENHILEKKSIPTNFLRLVISKIYTLFQNITLRYFDGVITPHNHVFKKFKKEKIRVELVPNFPNFVSEDIEEKDYLARNDAICYSGTVYLHSNQKIILDSIEKIDGLNYLIAGTIPKQCESIISAHPAREKVIFKGMLPPSDVDAFHKSALAGITILDYTKNLGGKEGTLALNKIFEYMASGLPVICTDTYIFQEIIHRHKCGIFVNPNSVTEVKAAIKTILGDKSESYAMGQRGKKAVIEEYSWKNIEPHYINIFKT